MLLLLQALVLMGGSVWAQTPATLDTLDFTKYGATPTITSGLYHNLMIDQNGKLYAWGANNFGQVGDGTKTDRTTPVLVKDGGGFKNDGTDPVISISTGSYHSLIATQSGKIYAWGHNQYGAVGDGTQQTELPLCWLRMAMMVLKTAAPPTL